MKKTEKTALTAAIFAAAMCGTANVASEPVEAAAYSTTSTTTVVGSEFVENQPAIPPDAIKELNSKMSAVYGPPPSYDESDNIEEDVVTATRNSTTTVYGPPRTTSSSSVEEDDVVTTIRITTVPLYGPPRTTSTSVPEEVITTSSMEDEDVVTTTRTTTVTLYGPPRTTVTTTVTTEDEVIAELNTNVQPDYGPVPFYGDVNNDGRTDVFDMILLREKFIQANPSYSFAADVNNDMKISVADLVLLQKFLLGKIDDIRQPENAVTTTMDEFQDVYGPPPTQTTAVPEDDDPTILTTRTYPVYGPPPSNY
ncbi:MAG: dockerin type I repeat-containing protein [Ruminococcus sp.]|nr:dockerin type I repeat-containing protein [Ruminococcus sp.]